MSEAAGNARFGHWREVNHWAGLPKSLTYIRYGYSIKNVTRNLSNAPLTPAVLHILLALSVQERHGYGIMKQVASDSQGKVKMGPGTLYGSLGRMMEAGLIRECDKEVDPELDDE